MSNPAGSTPQMPSDGTPGGGAGATADPAVAQPSAALRVAELAGECAAPPSATFTAVICIKCPDQTGVVGKEAF